MKIGLVLEGGAMRGLYSAGALDVLMDTDIPIDSIVGVSAGALFGMNYKSRQKGRVIRYNTHFAGNKEFMGVHSFLKTGNIMNEEFCFRKIVYDLDPVDFTTYRQTPEKFYCVVTNLETGKAEYKRLDDLENHDELEYLRASGSMPFVSKPIVVKGQRYLDGGCADSIPIEKMLDMEMDKIIVILTQPQGYQKKPSNDLLNSRFYKAYPLFQETLNTRYIRYNESLRLLEKLEKQKKVFVLRPSHRIHIHRLEKNVKVLYEMYDLGVDDMKKQLSDLKEYINE